ncbi:MAG: Tad domain-containing protein [Chloroflexota bacterium]
MKKIKFQENGQALIIIALAAVVLLGFAALAIDGSMAFSDRRHAQNAADTAAMAAALAKTRGDNTFLTVGQARATSNGYDNNNTTNIVVITTTPTPTGACPGTGIDIKVTVTSYVKTTFSRIVGRSQFTNVVSATARACDVFKTGGAPLYAGNAVYSTRTTACGNGVSDKAIYVGGSSQIQLWGGGMGSASSDGGCLHFKGGEAQFKLTETSPKTCADISTAAPSGGLFTSVSPQDGCGNKHYNVAAPTPPADLGITCPTNTTKPNSSTLSPGNFTGTFPGAGITTLQPGTYCVNGDFTLNGGASLSGSGVTIVLNTGGIKWNGSMTLNLSGPTSGPYKGLTIYAPPSNTSQMTMNGSSNVTLTGTLLAQNAPCDFVGSGQIQKVTLQMICYTWQMNGSADVQIMYDANTLYSPGSAEDPSISLLN